MTRRKSAIQKAIEKIDEEIAILQHARDRLVAQVEADERPRKAEVTDLRPASRQTG